MPGYAIVEQLYLGSRTAVYRAIQTAEQRSVVIKVLRREYPSFGELVQFRNQYIITKTLDISGIVRPLRLEPLGSGYALVMEDWGGTALGQYLQQQALDVAEVLAIAIQLATILHELHQKRIIHKDIKPANILIQPESKQVKLIDFSIASLLPKETQEIQNPNVLEGTLAYLAPEQTGRMNRGIDYRADFYALGVTLYELLSGQLPFQSNDPMELVHSHLAKMPPALENEKEIPAVVSKIVLKLMAKNAEDRYQSALGLKYDLENCLNQSQKTGEMQTFELGQRDLSDRFLIPEKLYGREQEVQMLLDAFERVASPPQSPLKKGGGSELMLVAGFSGIGKTAVVNEVHKPITRQNGYFIKGKFDQFNRNIPLSAFVQALRDLMGQLLSESDVQLQNWKTQILAAVGENGQVLIEVIPELEQIIGKQPSVAELSGTAAQNRFNLLFQKFIEVFTTPEHPLVLFLDDLQWADSASLQLMKLLMNDNGYLLMLGAYRDNEVFPAHPFILIVEELKQAQVIVNTITLEPLAFADTNHLVADTLNCSLELAQPLTELINRKTQGNPFFTTQFLKALHEDEHITFNQNLRYWECDIAQVNLRSLTDDVVEFMALQLQKLPDETQQVLKLAACVGNQFDLATLAIVFEQSATDTATALWKALQEGLILPTSQGYKFFQDTEPTDTQNAVNPTYRFLHDRVQQAAYSLIPEDQKQLTHLKIGQLLLEKLTAQEREESLFDIVNHFNSGQANLVNPSDREQCARLNLSAGQKAKTSTAYNAAFEYLTTGIQLLSQTCWQTQYDLALSLQTEAAGVAYLGGRFEELDEIAQTTLTSAKTFLDKIKIYETQIQAYLAQNKLDLAIQTGQTTLKSLAVHIPQQANMAKVLLGLAKTKLVLAGKKIPDLVNLPTMQAPKDLAAMRILASTLSAAYIGAPKLLPILAFKQVNLSIKRGNTALSAFAYSWYGTILCGVLLDIETGYQFGQLAIQVQEKLNAKDMRCRVMFMVNCFMRHWKDPIHTTIAPLQEAYQAGLETGDLEYASWSAIVRAEHLYCVGRSLPELEPDLKIYAEAISQFKQNNALVYINIYRQAVENLLGKSANPTELSGNCYSEQTDLPVQIEAGDRTGLAFSYATQLELCYRFGNLTKALEKAGLAKQYEEACAGLLVTVPLYFYDSLTRLAIYPDVSPSQQKQMLKRVAANQKKMKIWAQFSPENHQHKYDLVEAERQRVLGEKNQAMELYDRAIANANVNQMVNEESLANELAAKFYLDWGKEKVAQDYLTNAYYGYVHWGAKAKVQDLEKRYPQLLAPILQQEHRQLSTTETVFAPELLTTSQTASAHSSSSGSTSISATLDLATVLKASQTLSSEIQLDKLLATLLQTVLENAGADKGVLLLPRDQEWCVEAVATTDQPAQIQSVPLSESPDLPPALIQTVKRSLQPVVIVDALAHPTLATNAYILQHQPQSVLCTPILRQGKLVAILYLENRLTVGAFTGDRVQLLNFLCAQAAISLENARLYEQKQEKLQQLQNKNRLLACQSAISQIAAHSEDLSTMLQQFCQVMVDLLDAAFARVWVLNPTDNMLELKASAGLYTHLNGGHQYVPVGKFKIGLIAQERTPHLTNDVLNDPRVGNPEWAKQEGMVAFAGYPLLIDSELLGVVAMFSRTPICTSTLESLQIVATEISLAIQRKLLERTVEQKAIALEKMVQELQQAQLQMVQGEKMASLGNLVSGVAHEINNPLGFLNGSINNAKEYVQDLLDYVAVYQQHYPNPVAPVQDKAEDIDLEFLSEDLPNLLDSMCGATDRIKGISTSLRTFSRADAEYKVPANLHEGLDSTLLILKYRLKANEFRPAIQVVQNYGELSSIDCFPGQLNQVFMNILANAVDVFDEMAQQSSLDELKANPQLITIQTALIKEKNTVEIRIRDNGKGMTEETKARIFDHLFTTKSVGKGTGLGLAIARQIVVEKHGGQLLCDSTVGGGTEFLIQLPIQPTFRTLKCHTEN
ncbi:MAG: AAA family ATPase [Oscillatoriales cyanobacterium RM2_1_1]|nr:AAA family ATPase [Oscillatoriales cyanobacterium SM2_3_0]NJO46525.1 AAA family ATPase [Oscillatoriales cyanobacterium RM2_1_1]